jgi:hypothetical protein
MQPDLVTLSLDPREHKDKPLEKLVNKRDREQKDRTKDYRGDSRDNRDRDRRDIRDRGGRDYRDHRDRDRERDSRRR